jgi:hypothetical protein
MDYLRKVSIWHPLNGIWKREKPFQSNWAPEFYQKLDLEFPEAAHFGELPSLDGLKYDPVHGEFHFETVEVEHSSQLADLLAVGFGALIGIYSFRTLLLTPWRGTIRKLITDQIGSAPPAIHNYSRLRKAFNDAEFFNGTEIRNHSHGKSAGHRVAVNRFASHLCTLTGLEQYSFQMSKRDQSENVRGSRTYYWAKDVNAFPSYDQIEKHDFVTMVDVDYYIDMPEHLAENPQPHLIYTVQPETAGDTLEDYSYSFNEVGELVWKVSGGAVYKHKLWNYGTDWFTTSRTFFGLPYKTVVYDVHARRTSDNKQLVMLTPMRVTYGLAAIFAAWMGRALQRYNPVKNGFSKVNVVDQGGKWVSVARVGAETSCTVKTTVFDSLQSTKNISPNTKLNLYQVKSVLTHAMPDYDKDVYAPILTDYLNNVINHYVDDLQAVDVPKMVAVAFLPPDPSDKPVLEAFAAPFVPPAFVPINNKTTSDQSINGRVLLPRQQVTEILGEFKMTTSKQEALAAFVKRLVPVPHKGVPLDFDSVSDRQTKPGQKKDLQESGFWAKAVSIVKTFVKREAYGKPTDPRNITTFNPKSKIDYAHFMYPLMDHMKELPFYAFGKTPLSVAERVAEIASNASTVACPDISRMDGFVNLFCRLLERAVGNRFFALEHLDAFAAAHDLAFNNIGITSHGMRYEQEFSRGSGEMGTSVWNSIENLFIIFYAHWLTHKDYDQAWKFLLEKVLAGGDDGLVADMGEEILIRAARDIGFILKCPIFKKGEAGVNFLARVYGPDVWSGDTNSMCSLRRQMEKFHLTTKCNIPPTQKLYEKSLSFSFTDSNTPVIGPMVKRVLALTPHYRTTNTIKRYGDEWDLSVQYPNSYAAWMDVVAAEELPLIRLAEFEAWARSAPGPEFFLCCPCFYDEGREYTYDEWDCVSGLLIKRTLEVLRVKTTKLQERKEKFNIAKVKFGETETALDPKKKGS